MLIPITLTPTITADNKIILELNREQYNAIVYALATLDKKREAARKYHQEKKKTSSTTTTKQPTSTKISLKLPDVITPQESQ